MDYKEYFKKQKIKLTSEQKQLIKISGLLTAIELGYHIPRNTIEEIESRIIKLIKLYGRTKK